MDNKHNIEIRTANEKDIPEIVVIHKECILKTNSTAYSKEIVEEWVRQISEEKVLNQFYSTTWLVLLVDNMVVGFCQYDLKDGELLQIQVFPKYQDSGCGSDLYSAVEADFNKNKLKKIILFATLNAVGFYESLGFRKIKPFKFKLDKCFIKMFKMSKEL